MSLYKNKYASFTNSVTLVSLIQILLVSTCYAQSPDAQSPGNQPNWLDKVYDNPVAFRYYDGKTDDLLTAGLSHTELRMTKEPINTKENTSPKFLRKLTYYTNIRALIDVSSAGGYGRLYGPPENSKAIAGSEYISWKKDNNGNVATSFSLQIPDNFNQKSPCLVAAPSSGSRGIYGAVGTSGDWALRKQCAVVYTDKGTGSGFVFNMTTPHSQSLDLFGTLSKPQSFPTSLFTLTKFTPIKNKKELVSPFMVAEKHAHSQQNPEADWGQFTLDSIRFARAVLAAKYGEALTRKLKVIASSISNGGSAVLRAAEQDKQGLIHAVVAAEPNITPKQTSSLTIEDQHGIVSNLGRSLYDYSTILGLYQPCALLSKQLAGSPFYYFSPSQTEQFKERCQGLKDQGLLKTNSLEEQAEESLNKIHQSGILPESDFLSNFSIFSQLWPAINTTYGFAYQRLDASNTFCDYFFSATNKEGLPIKLQEDKIKTFFAHSSGIVPTSGIELIKLKNEKPIERRKSSKDWDLSGALCFRETFERSQKITNTFSKSLNAIKASADLHGKPGIIIHGRSDSLIAINHSSRAYVAANAQKNKKTTQLKYYEITNAQHFDALAGISEFSQKIIPLHYYLEQSLDLMYEHLFSGTKLPPSQTVSTQLRKKTDGIVENLQLKHLPEISMKPGKPIEVIENKIIIN